MEGNLTERRTLVGGSPTGVTTFYTWDHRNRLETVTEKTAPTGGSTNWIVTYAYDAFDRRVSKSVDNSPTGSINRYEYFVWDGDDVVLDFVDADGGATPSAALDMRYLHAAPVDQILAQETAGGTVRWHLAVVIALSDQGVTR